MTFETGSEVNNPSSIETVSRVEQLLEPFQRFGVNLGLSRIEQLLQTLGNPHRRVPLIHVGGSNGKGSVCAYLAQVLQTAGYRVGRYTSPHLVSWTERIRLNGEEISCADFEATLRRVITAVDPDQPQPTLFEIVTAAAFLYFSDRQVDVAVVEVGLGGRLDATNVCDRPLASVITSISKEHWQVLGDTLAKIATEKAGIFKTGYPVIAGPLPTEAHAVIAARAEALNCPLTWVEPAQADAQGKLWVGEVNHGLSYELGLQGPIQRTNSAIAIATLQSLRTQGWKISDGAIAQGLAQTRWPGRMEWIRWRGHSLLIDGAHNPAAAKALRDYVDTLEAVRAGQPVTWVMGMLSTKEHQAVFEQLLRGGDRLYTAPVPGHSTADPRELVALAQAVCPELAIATPTPSIFEALEQSFQRSSDPSGVTVFCGSLYLLGHFLAVSAQP